MHPLLLHQLATLRLDEDRHPRRARRPSRPRGPRSVRPARALRRTGAADTAAIPS
jgi:hypothetical protein